MRDAREVVWGILGANAIAGGGVSLLEADRRAAKLEALRELKHRAATTSFGWGTLVTAMIAELEKQEGGA